MVETKRYSELELEKGKKRQKKKNKQIKEIRKKGKIFVLRVIR